MAALLGILAAVLLIAHFNAKVRPQLVALAEAQLRSHLTVIANDVLSAALDGEGLSYGDLVTMNTAGGAITSLTTDTVRLNRLRADLLERIVPQVDDLNSHDLGVPLGALTGLDLFSALGPHLPVKVLSVASADAVYENTFTDAGINQTLHRILLDVTIRAQLLLPGGIVTVEVSVPVCVAETVIVGQVPQTYLQPGRAMLSG